MASFGIGIGAFADGFVRGVGLGKQLKGVRRENEAEEVREKAMEEARKARAEAVEAETARMTGIGPQAPGAPGQSTQPASNGVETFPVGESGTPQQPAASNNPAATGLSGQSTMPADNARKLAEAKVPSVIEFFQKQGVPKIAEMYLTQGDPGKAEAWQKWAKESKNQRSLATWAKAWRSSQLGDIEKAADHFFDLYKDLDDGVTPKSKEVVKDKDGNITGFNVVLHDDDTGEDRSMFIDRQQLLEAGLAALSPPQMFEAVWSRQQAIDKQRASAQAEVGKTQLQLQKEIAVENVKQRGRVELDQKKFDRNVQVLKESGYDEAFIRSVIPSLIGADTSGPYRKGPSPQETVTKLHEKRMANDFSYGRLPPEEQRKLIAKDMQMINELAQAYSASSQQSTSDTPSSGATPAQPGSAPTSGNPAARGLPVLDRKTGQLIYR